MATYEISAVPVDEHDKLVGVVSEADLLNKQEYRGGTEAPQRPEIKRYQQKWRKAHAATAGDLMTHRVITVDAGDPVIIAARRLANSNVRRLFVVDAAGRLVGVVSRRDLLRPFLRSDEAIRAEVERDLFREIPVADSTAVEVGGDRGVVTLIGRLPLRSQSTIAARLAQAMPGVVDVRNKLRFDVDDLPAPQPM